MERILTSHTGEAWPRPGALTQPGRDGHPSAAQLRSAVAKTVLALRPASSSRATASKATARAWQPAGSNSRRG